MILELISIYILLFLSILFLIIAIVIGGVAVVLTSNRFKCFLVHLMSLLIVGYFLSKLQLHSYVQVLFFAIGITLISGIYRLIMFTDKWNWNIRGQWFLINIVTLFVVQILFNVLQVTSRTGQLLFAGLCLTLVGVFVHPKGNKKRDVKKS